MDQINLFDLIGGIDNKKSTSEKIIIDQRNIIKIRSFAYSRDCWHYDDGHWHVIYSSVALLENEMVYFKDWFAYPFLYTFERMDKAYSFYGDCLKKVFEFGKLDNDFMTEIKIHPEVNEMYHCEKNIYGCFEYYNNNFGENTWSKRIK